MTAEHPSPESEVSHSESAPLLEQEGLKLVDNLEKTGALLESVQNADAPRRSRIVEFLKKRKMEILYALVFSLWGIDGGWEKFIDGLGAGAIVGAIVTKKTKKYQEEARKIFGESPHNESNLKPDERS